MKKLNRFSQQCSLAQRHDIILFLLKTRMTDTVTRVFNCIKRFAEGRSRTGSPCVHKGVWGLFPNKQRRGYHGALLASSTQAGFPVCFRFNFVSIFSPFREMATISSQLHSLVPARLLRIKHARHLLRMSHLVSRIRIFIHLIKRTCNTPAPAGAFAVKIAEYICT